MKSGTHRFIIGIGSQRAASTLLHTLLSDSSDAFMHPVKELHYFDTLFGVRPQEALTEFSTRQLMREVDHIVAASECHGIRSGSGDDNVVAPPSFFCK